MKKRHDTAFKSPVTRRTFFKTGAIATASIASLTLAGRAATNTNGNLRIFQIGVGGIGGMQRDNLKNHPKVEFVGFCDVDQSIMDRVAADFGNPFKVKDYRRVFDNRADEFDAVIVDTPDHHHVPMILTAFQHDKHVYAQKPLVQQLDELGMIRDALAAKPNLVTQMGNQRACNTGRMQAVAMLKNDQLGKPVAAYIWTGSVARNYYFDAPWSDYKPAQPIPDTLDWNLWRGPIREDIPYSDNIAPRRWRSYWETGGGMLGDWGCHLIDLLYFAYDLPSPQAVQTFTPRPANTSHTAHNLSTITYPGGDRFARDKFVLQYNDSDQQPSFAALGLPDMKVPANHTLVVCEEGTLLLQSEGDITVFRNGKVVENEPRPETTPHHHWHDWVDNCLGAKKHLWTPLTIGWRITEPALLAAKATRYPGADLRWDGTTCRFTNHDEANQTIVSRDYREGFAPPKVA